MSGTQRARLARGGGAEQAFPSQKPAVEKSESPPGGNQMQALVIGGEKWVVLLRVSHRAKPAVSKLPRYKVQHLQRSQHPGGRGLAERQDPDRVKQRQERRRE